MPNLRVGLVGCGFMGKMHANVYSLLPGADLVACLDSRSEPLMKLGEQFGAAMFSDFNQMVSQVDVVDICLPTYLHAEFVIKAAKAGKHVICEKPMAMSLREADEMITACTAAKVELFIAQCIRFWPEYALLKQMVEDGRYGKLLSLNLTRLGQFPSWSSGNWLADESKSGGGVLDMHIHDSDFALYLMGTPSDISSFGNVDSRGPSYAFTTLRYPGAVVHLEGGWNFPEHTPFRMTFRAAFERAAVFMDGGPLTVYQDGKEPVVPEFPKLSAEGGGNISDLGGYYAELEYFVDRVGKGLPLEVVTAETSRASLALVLEEIRQIKVKI